MGYYFKRLYFFIWRANLERVGKTEGYLTSSGSLLKWLPWPELSWSKAESLEILLGFLLGVRTQGLEPSSTTFPDCRHGAESEVKQLGLELAPLEDADTANGGLAWYSIVLGFFSSQHMWWLFYDHLSLTAKHRKTWQKHQMKGRRWAQGL